MKRTKQKIITRSTADLANVLGLGDEDAASMEFRARLNKKIVELVEKKKLSHAEVAKAARASRIAY